MRVYSSRQFKRDGFTIPNLPSEYQLVEVDLEEGSYYKQFTLFKNGRSLLKFKSHKYDGALRFLDVDFTKIVDEGTDVDSTMHPTTIGFIYLDDLYYTYNPVNLRQKGGKVFSKTFLGLKSRLSEGREYANTKLTKKTIQYIDEYIKDKVTREHPEITPDTYAFYQACNRDCSLSDTNHAAFHSFTGKLISRPKCVNGANGDLWVSYSDFAEDFGLRSETYRYKTYWIESDEFLLDGTIVSLRDGSEVCPDCGTTVPTTYMIEDPDDHHRTCKKCAAQTYEIHNYSTRVPSLLKFKAKKVTASTIYLGCELEYETSNQDVARQKVGRALKGHAIMKSDGSIRNGFEVVTCPATLEIHLEVFKRFFENRPLELTIASNVGMHVHVSRAPLSVLTVGKMTEFMNRPDNVKFITHIAGRSPNTYCQQDRSRSLSFPLVYKTGERYNTLNLNNKDTVEFRIFSTPLTYEDFAHKVQFCQALTDYSKPGVLSVPLKEQTSYSHFIKWALANHRDYPELASKIKSFSA